MPAKDPKKLSARITAKLFPFAGGQGRYSLQPHVSLPDGTFEEEHGRQGFFGKTSHLYHRHPPTGWLRIEGPLKPHAYRAVEVSEGKGSEGAPTFLLENSDVRLGISKFSRAMGVLMRNADGDEVRFIHE